MGVTELAVLRWLHILAMVYWLGGEWGVFNTSTHVINRKLSMEERRRHMQTAYNIDILARRYCDPAVRDTIRAFMEPTCIASVGQVGLCCLDMSAGQ